MAIDFFNYTTDLRKYAPQLKTDTKSNEFTAYLRPQKQKLIRLIGKETYTVLLDAYIAESGDPILVEGIEYISAALANLTAIPYFIFDAQERNNTENNLFRYQENAQLAEYLENAWSELDNLLEHLEANAATYPDYQNTDTFTVRESLFIKNAYEFQKYFGSNAYKSAYFYNSTVFIQLEAQKDELDSRYEDWIQTTDDNEKFLIGKIIAYKTMSMACIQFDFTELPKPLRGAISSEIDTRKSKGTMSENEIKLRLSETFEEKARKFMMELENARNESRNDGEFVTPEDINTSDDKFYLPGMP